MKIYRIKNGLSAQFYIIASNINNAIKKFVDYAKENEEDADIKEIELISFCIIGE
jgi:hypothetical protein